MNDAARFYIGGEWSEPLSEARLDVENPATEETIARIALGSARDVDRAVAAARAAFARPRLSPAERRALLERIREVTLARMDDLAAAITAEMGAPATLAREEQAAVALTHLDGFLAAMEGFDWEEYLGNGDLLLREPAGVCGLITPWNWPVNQIALKVLAALAAGCTMVLKPSELTPLSAVVYAEILHEAGVPPGAFNLVHGLGSEAGAALSRHPDVDVMSFTGSVRGGTAVARDAAGGVKRIALELGGKSPNLVFADCGPALEERVRASVAECMLNSGQSCDAPTRMLIERPAYDRACRIAARAADDMAVGDPREEGDRLGPLISADHRARVLRHIEDAAAEGARPIAGGPERPRGCETGHYVRPTVFADVTPGMAIWREEVFGPVLAIMPFDTEEEAVRLANDTPYGLAAYVQTGSRARVLRVAAALRAGMVRACGAVHAPGSPFGGYGASGVGREGGRLGIEEFTEAKVLSLPEAWR